VVIVIRNRVGVIIIGKESTQNETDIQRI